MSTFSVHIDTDNAAFTDDGYEGRGELLQVLWSITEKVRNGSDGGPVLDTNGNTIGQFHWDKEGD